MTENEATVSVAEAAEILGLLPNTVIKLCISGKLAASSTPRGSQRKNWHISRQALTDYQNAPPPPPNQFGGHCQPRPGKRNGRPRKDQTP